MVIESTPKTFRYAAIMGLGAALVTTLIGFFSRQPLEISAAIAEFHNGAMPGAIVGFASGIF